MCVPAQCHAAETRQGTSRSLEETVVPAGGKLPLCLLYRAQRLDSGVEKDVVAELAANAKRRRAAASKQRRDFGSFFDR